MRRIALVLGLSFLTLGLTGCSESEPPPSGAGDAPAPAAEEPATEETEEEETTDAPSEAAEAATPAGQLAPSRDEADRMGQPADGLADPTLETPRAFDIEE